MTFENVAKNTVATMTPVVGDSVAHKQAADTQRHVQQRDCNYNPATRGFGSLYDVSPTYSTTAPASIQGPPIDRTRTSGAAAGAKRGAV